MAIDDPTPEADHYVLTSHAPKWRRQTGRNGQITIAFYSIPGGQVREVILVTGYNIFSDDDHMIELATEFPTVPIIFNSQIGVRPPGSEDRNGPGWRILVADDDSTSPFDVPFNALADSGISLY